MTSLKWILATSIALAMTGMAPNAAAEIGGASPGYYYIATTGAPLYQYRKVGAFATQDACAQARAADYGNGDDWIPYDGTGIQCTYVYATEVGSMNDVLSHWNSVSGGNSGTTAGHMNEQKLRAISELRGIYQVESYEADMVRILQTRDTLNPR